MNDIGVNKMKIRVTTLLALVGGSALALASGPVLLRHNFAPNQKDEYKVEMTMLQKVAIPSMGDQDMNVKGGMKYHLTYGAKDATSGKADFGLKITDIKMDMEGPMADAADMTDQIPKEMKLEAKIDDRNRITDYKVDKANMSMMMMSGANSAMSNFFIEFPEKEVAIGDTWDVKMPKNPMMGNEEAILKAKLVGEKDVDGKKMYVLTLEGKINTKIDMGEMMKGEADPTGMLAGMDMVVSGSMDMNSEALVDQASGKTISMTTKMKTKQQMEMKAMGMTLDMSGDITMKVSLAK